MIKDKIPPICRSGKIKIPLLVMSLLIVAFFVLILGLKTSPIAPNSELATLPTDTPTTTLETSTSSSSSTLILPTPTSSPVSTPGTVVTPPSPPPNIGHAVGIAAGSGLSKLSAADLNKQLDLMVALGITWVRFDIEWGNVQYSSAQGSNWYSYDTMMNAIAAHHLKGLGIILFTPEWARNPSCGGGAKCPPTDPAQFATFASQVVARYKDKGVHAWEIWNEPNSYDFWATKTDCNAYTALLKVTYPAIKKVDPTATIVTGGVAPETTDNNNISQRDFLTCIYKDGGKNYFDAVGDHSYTFPALPSSNNTNVWAQMSLTSPSLRSIMIANGDADKKIWITEYGTPTNGPDPHWFVSEDGQAAMVTDAMTLYKTYSWTGPIFWYSLKDSGTSASTLENFFGLVRADNSLKPAYSTLKSIISAGL